jgi:anaerobic magnesium-protoporphyrin IX monomethyl ester cyclase
MSELLLVQPPCPTPSRVHTRDRLLSAPPVALGYLASLLLQEGYNVDIVDMEILGLGTADVYQIMETQRPRLVGISATTLTYKNALRIAAIGKSINPEVLTVLGGPHVTFAAKDALSWPQVDYVIRGEGELALLDLARLVLEGWGDLGNIGGLSARKPDGTLIHNPRNPLLRDLDGIPFPARHLFPLHLYSAPGLIITGRGCEGRCTFCAARGIAGGSYRIRSVGNVLQEIEVMISALGLHFLFFGDDTFTVFPSRTKALCQALRERNGQVAWICETRADAIDRATLQLMSQAGCKVIQFGAESGSQKILDSINKGITLARLRESVAAALEVGISATCSFMFPHPEDTWETVEETKALICELQAIGARTAVSLTTPFPGTYLANHLWDLGLTVICDDTDQYDFATPVIETRTFDVWDIREIYLDLVLLCLEGNGSIDQGAVSRVSSARRE